MYLKPHPTEVLGTSWPSSLHNRQGTCPTVLCIRRKQPKRVLPIELETVFHVSFSHQLAFLYSLSLYWFLRLKKSFSTNSGSQHSSLKALSREKTREKTPTPILIESHMLRLKFIFLPANVYYFEKSVLFEKIFVNLSKYALSFSYVCKQIRGKSFGMTPYHRQQWQTKFKNWKALLV